MIVNIKICNLDCLKLFIKTKEGIMGLFNKLFNPGGKTLGVPKCYDSKIRNQQIQNRMKDLAEKNIEDFHQKRLYDINGTGSIMNKIEYEAFRRAKMLNAGRHIAANPGGAIGWGVSGTPEGAEFGRSAWDIGTGLGNRPSLKASIDAADSYLKAHHLMNNKPTGGINSSIHDRFDGLKRINSLNRFNRR